MKNSITHNGMPLFLCEEHVLSENGGKTHEKLSKAEESRGKHSDGHEEHAIRVHMSNNIFYQMRVTALQLLRSSEAEM